VSWYTTKRGEYISKKSKFYKAPATKYVVHTEACQTPRKHVCSVYSMYSVYNMYNITVCTGCTVCSQT